MLDKEIGNMVAKRENFIVQGEWGIGKSTLILKSFDSIKKIKKSIIFKIFLFFTLQWSRKVYLKVDYVEKYQTIKYKKFVIKSITAFLLATIIGLFTYNSKGDMLINIYVGAFTSLIRQNLCLSIPILFFTLILIMRSLLMLCSSYGLFSKFNKLLNFSNYDYLWLENIDRVNDHEKFDINIMPYISMFPEGLIIEVTNDQSNFSYKYEKYIKEIITVDENNSYEIINSLLDKHGISGYSAYIKYEKITNLRVVNRLFKTYGTQIKELGRNRLDRRIINNIINWYHLKETDNTKLKEIKENIVYFTGDYFLSYAIDPKSTEYNDLKEFIKEINKYFILDDPSNMTLHAPSNPQKLLYLSSIFKMSEKIKTSEVVHERVELNKGGIANGIDHYKTFDKKYSYAEWMERVSNNNEEFDSSDLAALITNISTFNKNLFDNENIKITSDKYILLEKICRKYSQNLEDNWGDVLRMYLLTNALFEYRNASKYRDIEIEIDHDNLMNMKSLLIDKIAVLMPSDGYKNIIYKDAFVSLFCDAIVQIISELKNESELLEFIKKFNTNSRYYKISYLFSLLHEQSESNEMIKVFMDKIFKGLSGTLIRNSKRGNNTKIEINTINSKLLPLLKNKKDH